MSFDIIQQSRILTRVLRAIGLWRQNTTTTWYGQLYPLVLHLPLTFTLTALMCLEIVLSSDLEHSTDVLYIGLTELALVVKIINIWRFCRQAAEILHEWSTQRRNALDTLTEHLMWQRSQKIFGVVSFLYIGCSCSAACSHFCTVLINGSMKLPFYVWLPFDSQKPDVYWFVYFYELLAMPLTCVANVTLDMFHCYLMLHVSLCFKIIGMRLELLGHTKDSLTDERVHEKFVAIIHQHHSVRRYLKQCELIVSFPILIQIILSSFILCFTAYRLQKVNISNDPVEFSTVVQYALVMILQIFIPCYYANEIIVNSDRLSLSVYSANWTDLSQRNRRCILMFMQSLKEPQRIRAGHFFDIGLPIFSNTISNAYNLLALMLNMKD